MRVKKAEVEAARTALNQARQASETRLPNIETKLAALAGVTPLLTALAARGGRLELAQKADAGTPYSDTAWDELQRATAQLPALEGAETALAEAKSEVETGAKTLQTLQAEAGTLGETLTSLKNEGVSARTTFDAAVAAYEAAVVTDRAAALREHLQVGEACPVCAQTVTELPPLEDAQTALLKKARDQAETALTTLRENYQTTKARLETVTARAKDKAAAVENVQKRLTRLETALAAQNRTFTSLGVTGSDTVKKALETRKTLLLAALAAQIVEQTGGADPRKVQQALQTEKRALETGLKTAETAFQTAQTAFDRLGTQAEMLTHQLAELQSEFESARSALTKSLKNAEFASAAEAGAALLSEPQTAALEAQLKTFELNKESAERRDVELQARLSGRTLDEQRYGSLKEEAGALETALADLQKTQGRLERELAHVAEQLERAKDLRAQLKEAAARFDLYRLLTLDLRGNEFQEYLLAQVQAKLARRASHILRDVTEGRYDLRLEDGDYVVRDAWATGELRNAKTLSGGETFIASLALALALSDTVAGSQALGALFLDEGFGTLDTDTLASVAGVLENLTREGRMVGVITHVKELTERLPARLKVSKGVDGSTLSWDL